MGSISKQIIWSAAGSILAIVAIELTKRFFPALARYIVPDITYHTIQTVILIVILVVVVSQILQTRQIGRAVTFIYPKTDSYPKGRRIQVHMLQEGLTLTWETIWKGADELYDQITDHRPGITDPIFLGVNTTGVAMAAILADRFRQPLGIVRTSWVGGERIVGDVVCLGSKDKIEIEDVKEKNVIIVDSEMKTGDSLMKLKDKLCTNFGLNQKNIKIAILILCNIEVPDPEYDICGLQKKTQPDFIAYFSKGVPKRPYNIQ